MSGDDDNAPAGEIGTAEPEAPPPEPAQEPGREETGRPSRRAPSLRSYVLLNLGVSAFLVAQAIFLIEALGSSQVVWLFSGLLAGGFVMVSVFDCVWNRLSGDRAVRAHADDGE